MLTKFREWDAQISKRFILFLARVAHVVLPTQIVEIEKIVYKEREPREWLLQFPRNNRAAALASKFRHLKRVDKIAQVAKRS